MSIILPPVILRALSFLLALVLPMAAADCDDHADKIAHLIAPTKLVTLGERGANPRIQKTVAILEVARRDGCKVSTVASKAVALAG